MKTEHKKEIRDTTGNILRPGMYGYEERLAASVESARASHSGQTISRHALSGLRHKIRMAWTMTEREDDGSGFCRVPDERLQDQNREVEFITNAILPTYASRRDSALWLDREIKKHRAYQIAVCDTPLGEKLPQRPMFSDLLDKAFRLAVQTSHDSTTQDLTKENKT